MIKGHIIKLKSDKIEEWQRWGEFLMQNRKEAQETIREENLKFEGFFIFEINNDFYTCGFMLENEGGVKETNLQKEINNLHRAKMKECFDAKISEIQQVYFFESK